MTHCENISAKISEAIFPGRRVRSLTVHLEVGAFPTVEAEIYCGDELRPVAELLRPKLTDAEREAVRFCVTASLPETEKLGGVAGDLCRMHAASLRNLLERTK